MNIVIAQPRVLSDKRHAEGCCHSLYCNRQFTTLVSFHTTDGRNIVEPVCHQHANRKDVISASRVRGIDAREAIVFGPITEAFCKERRISYTVVPVMPERLNLHATETVTIKFQEYVVLQRLTPEDMEAIGRAESANRMRQINAAHRLLIKHSVTEWLYQVNQSAGERFGPLHPINLTADKIYLPTP